MRMLSKSKLIAFRQCPKRLWLEVHHPERAEVSAQSRYRMADGNEIGVLARRIYDPDGRGALIDAQRDGYDAAFARSQELLRSRTPIFEAFLRIPGALAFADILLPAATRGRFRWRMVEVKSSTSVKQYHLDDVAIQAHVAHMAGVTLDSVALALVDSRWVYAGDGDYSGLLREEDLTDHAIARRPEAAGWIDEARRVVARPQEPPRTTGSHCTEPFECPFLAYCRSREPQARHPATWLPNVRTNALKAWINSGTARELTDVPDHLLNDQQLRVKQHTLAGTTYLDRKGAARALAQDNAPFLFLDFETVQLVIPRWANTRPYQQIPFQFSLHRLDARSNLEHREFIDVTGADPSRALAEALVQSCGSKGTVYAYNASFESTRIRELAHRFPDLAQPLLALLDRIVDLLPVTRDHYYHPGQEGSWSIKSVLPSIAPDLSYGALDGVQDGGMAMEAYREAIDPATAPARREQLRRQLLDYCRLDTLAMVRLWAYLKGERLPAS